MNTFFIVLQYDKQDWQHLGFLLCNLYKQFFIERDWEETKDTYYWIKMHLTYFSKRVEVRDDE